MQKLSCLVTLIVLLNVASNPSYAQCTHPLHSLDVYLGKSTQVVEATVVDAQSLWGSRGQYIYTLYGLEVHQVFKGVSKRYLTVAVLGGTVGGDAMAVAPASSLAIGQTGIYALRPPASPSILPGGTVLWPVFSAGAVAVYSPARDKALVLGREQVSLPEARRLVARHTGQPFSQGGIEPALPVLRSPSAQVEGVDPQSVAAGTGQTITIQGQGFGPAPGTVFFADADNGGNGFVAALPWHVEEWTNSKITVKVPHRAGTGPILIMDGDGGIAFSPFELEVSYAYTNVLSSGQIYAPKLVDHPSRADGGYLFRISGNQSENGASFAEVAGAEAALLAAAGAWQDSVGLPLYIGHDCPAETSIAFGSEDDGVNLISFDHDAWSVPAQIGENVLAATISRYARCGDSAWELVDVDIIIRRGQAQNEAETSLKWSFAGSPAEDELDFQTVLLHELGHALQLQHVVDPDGVMHYAATHGVAKHELGSEDDIKGGAHALIASRQYDPPQLPCYPLDHFGRSRRLGKYNPGIECGLVYNEDNDIQSMQQADQGPAAAAVSLEAYPNPKTKGAPLQLSVYTAQDGHAELRLYGAGGQLMRQKAMMLSAGTHTIQWALPGLPAGIYWLLLLTEQDRLPLMITIH